jgi:hypothetical protein
VREANMKILLAILALPAIGVLSSCGFSTKPDPWHTGLPPGGLLEDAYVRLDDGLVHPVVQSLVPEAEELLADDSAVALSDEDAARLAGSPLPNLPGKGLYLARGLYYVLPTGSFSVWLSQDHLVVHHGSLGAAKGRMSRQPVVLQLEFLPLEVFVSCSMAK